MRLLPNLAFRPPAAVRFLPSGRFFLRFVPLAPGVPVAEQAALALEGLAPFPPAQLYWGCWIAPDRASALVYAAHRRRFAAAETADWERDDLAVPDLLPLLGAGATRPGLLIHGGGTQLSGVAWTAAQTSRPAAILTRNYAAAPTEEQRREFAADLAARAGTEGDLPMTLVEGQPRARRDGGNLVLELAGADGAVRAAVTVPAADQEALDVRDRAFLGRRRRERRQGELIWKVLRTGVQIVAAALLLEAGALTLQLLDRMQQARVAAQVPVVARLETAHGLASRIDELTHRRLRFFEMLATINAARPASVQFTRTGTSGRNGLEIEAQTGSADDVGAYESALRALPAVEKVEVRDLRAREGVTTFGLSLGFKADAGAGPGGSP